MPNVKWKMGNAHRGGFHKSIQTYYGAELFRAVIFVLSGVRKFDWVVGMKLPVTSLGGQEIGSVNMVFAKTPNKNAPKRG